ncbi:MAG TPA: flavodoxin-dependent (E)-4-hydroxy-3-methylbut-2-enyl-diphosphate synthase [Erysipelothrix sp.]|nr:flavodoxin-dependent (E)-4-hydroxy-3-methylbut-2-enyl-diphosphate synthase [Erysipelothrix sp.]
MYTRLTTRPVKVGPYTIGGENQIILQSMTNTKTKDVQATIQQIKALLSNGCQIVRLAILDREDAAAIAEIKKEIHAPLVADIHFSHQLALASIEAGIDKIRINPGNIGTVQQVELVVNACKEKNIPIRIGVNSGSLEQNLLEKYGQPTPEAMIESAQRHVSILESLNFEDIILSFKASDVRLTIDTYRLAAKTFHYPLHLGVTEAGPLLSSAIKSSAALGTLIDQGIGDTLRISVSDDPVEEMKIGKQLLKSFGLIDDVPDLISCPTCGRLQYDMLPYVKEIEEFLAPLQTNISVAIMGCAVNGPQEASRADIGIAGGRQEALLFKHGQIIRKVPQDQLVDTLKAEILEMIETTK